MSDVSPGKPHVVVLYRDSYPPDTWRFDSHATVEYVTEAELAEALPRADVLFVWHFTSTAVPGAWPAEGGPGWIHIASAGVDKLLAEPLASSEVVITNSRGIFDQPIAEYVLTMVLALAKDLPTSLRAQDQRHWHWRETERLAGTRALVIGTGPIGRAIARLLTAAGLNVAGAGRSARSDDPDFGTVHASEALDGVWGEFDWIVLAAPLTPHTEGMIHQGVLSQLKPTARLINIGRGPLVVEDDLVAALQAGHLAGAGLDVFATEPLPTDSPLWDMSNVLVSPHMSGDTAGWLNELVALFAENLQRFTAAAPLAHVVDKQRGYVPGSATTAETG